MKNAWRCLSSGFVLLLLAGCASPSADQAATKAEDAEYVYVRVTGSNIPKRIKKSDIKEGTLAKDGDMQVVDKEQFMRSLPTSKKVDRGGG
jgi:hypothetical protein